jgi:signal transduction histidine kinase/ActR/RegA family two-component response regulator
MPDQIRVTPRWLMLLWHRIYEPWRYEGEGLQHWRELILFSIYFSSITMGLTAYVPGIMRLVAHAGWGVFPVTTSLYLIYILVLLFPGRLTFKFRALLAIGLVHFAGIFVLSILGPYSGGFIWLFCSAVLGGLLLGVRFSLVAIAVNALTLGVLGLLLTQGVFHWSSGGIQAFGPWMATSLNLLFLIAVTSVSAAVMMRGLEQTIVRQQHVSAKLEQERQELIQVRGQLQLLAVELIEAEEKERQRISLLLHDDLQQLLASANMQLQACEAIIPSNALLINVKSLLQESLKKTRDLSHELSPPILYHTGLVSAVQWLTEKSKKQFGLQVELKIDNPQLIENSTYKIFIFRAIQEQLFNIVKHSGVKTASIEISTSENDLTICIRDKGKGFSPASANGSEKSPGLGLVSLRERVRHIGGKLSIESAPGQGYCLILTLPLTLIQEKSDAYEPVPMKIIHDHRKMNKQQTRILLADDHKVMRQGLIQLMSGQPGIEIVGEASSGLEAIEVARKIQPDVIVMDVAMPIIDGIEATRRIKTELPHIRVIGLSMLTDSHVQQAMRDAGASAFLSKTESITELFKLIPGMQATATLA